MIKKGVNPPIGGSVHSNLKKNYINIPKIIFGFTYVENWSIKSQQFKKITENPEHLRCHREGI